VIYSVRNTEQGGAVFVLQPSSGRDEGLAASRELLIQKRPQRVAQVCSSMRDDGAGLSAAA